MCLPTAPRDWCAWSYITSRALTGFIGPDGQVDPAIIITNSLSTVCMSCRKNFASTFPALCPAHGSAFCTLGTSVIGGSEFKHCFFYHWCGCSSTENLCHHQFHCCRSVDKITIAGLPRKDLLFIQETGAEKERVPTSSEWALPQPLFSP